VWEEGGSTRTYKVAGMTCDGCEKAVTRAIIQRLGDDTAVEADAGKGEVRVSESSDPQIVMFDIDCAGYSVERVSD
jgi:copper chaperone